MPSEHPVLTCRCGHRHIGSPLLKELPSLHCCPMCGEFTLIRRELGENAHPDDRAKPEDWGPLG